MNIQTSLYLGEKICLAPINREKDAEVESRWTQDGSYTRLLDLKPAYPLSAFKVKKNYEDIEKEEDEKNNLFYFTIRSRADDRLIGFTRLYWVEWTNGAANVQIGIGDPADRRQGYSSEALRLLLRYAFAELNLYRLTAIIPEYNVGAIRLFEKAGFIQEVCRRQAVNRDGRRWDLFHYGLLRDDWR